MAFISSLEAKYQKTVGKAFFENNGIYMILCGYYNANRAITVCTLALIFYYTVLFWWTVIYGFFVKRDKALAMGVLHFACVTTYALVSQIIFLAVGKQLIGIVRLLDEGIYDYGDTIDAATRNEMDDISKKYRKFKKFIPDTLFKVYSFAAYCSVALFTSVSILGSDEDENTTRYTPLLKCTLFNARSWIGWAITVVLDICYFQNFVVITCALQFPFMCFIMEGCKELEFLHSCLKNLFRRANYVFEKKFGMKSSSSQSLEFQHCLNVCIKDSIRHHIATIRYLTPLTSVYSVPAFAVFFFGALMLGTSVLLFQSDEHGLAQQLAFITYAFTDVFHIFIFSYFGELVSQLSSGIHEKVYFCGWEDSSHVLRSYVGIIQMNANSRKIKLSALGFVDFNLNTFSNIMSSAYSFFNLLTASE